MQQSGPNLPSRWCYYPIKSSLSTQMREWTANDANRGRLLTLTLSTNLITCSPMRSSALTKKCAVISNEISA